MLRGSGILSKGPRPSDFQLSHLWNEDSYVTDRGQYISTFGVEMAETQLNVA